jgi:hypothetical protein
MSRRLIFLILAPLAACGERPAEPQADPVQVQRLIARLDAAQAVPEEAQEKLREPERIVAAVDRSNPDRLAGAAERLLD